MKTWRSILVGWGPGIRIFKAVEIQDHFLAGRRKKAQEAVPDELIDKVALVGPKERIIDRLQDWKKAAQVSHVDSLLIKGATKSDLLVFAETVL